MLTSWEKISEEPYQPFWRKLIKKTYRLPDGTLHTFDILDDGDAVCVFALTSENKVVLTKQYRPGPDKIIYELPGGAVDHGEDALEAIKREFLEETGYTGEFDLLGTMIRDAYSTRTQYNFIAKNCHKVQEQELDEHEFIDVEEVSLERFKEILKIGEMSDVACGYIALLKIQGGEI